MEKFKSFLSGKKFVNVIAVVLFIIALIVFAVPVFSSGEYDEKYAENQSKIEELEAEISELENKATADEVTPAVITNNLNSASDKGVAVAKLQNNYLNIMTDIDLESNAEAYAKAITDNADALREYFSDGLDAQVPWFGSYQKYTWVFTTTYSTTDGNIPCLFLCYKDVKDSSTMLAYVKATYSSSLGKFTSFEKANTSVGDNYLSKEYSDKDGNVKIKDSETEANMPTISPELQAVIDAQTDEGGK